MQDKSDCNTVLFSHFSSSRATANTSRFTSGLWILRGKKAFSRKWQAKFCGIFVGWGFFLSLFFFNSYLLPSLRDVRSFLLYGQASAGWLEPCKWASASSMLPSPTNAVACWQPRNILMVSICICTAGIISDLHYHSDPSFLFVCTATDLHKDTNSSLLHFKCKSVSQPPEGIARNSL